MAGNEKESGENHQSFVYFLSGFPKDDTKAIENESTSKWSLEHFLKPIRFQSAVPIEKVACGEYLAAFITKNGSLYNWSWEESEKELFSCSPQLLEASAFISHPIIDVSCGSRHLACCTVKGGCFIVERKPNKDARSILWNIPCHLLQSDTMIHPLQIAEKVISTKSGPKYTIALTENGTMYGIGDNSSGVLGKEPDYEGIKEATPIYIHGFKIAQVAAGRRHVLALTENGVLFSWGRNDAGQLGLGDFVDSYTPCRVSKLSETGQLRSRMISACEESAAVTEQNEVYVWGCKGWNLPKLYLRNGTVQPMQIALLQGYLIQLLEDCMQVCPMCKNEGEPSDGSTIKLKISEIKAVAGQGGRLLAVADKVPSMHELDKSASEDMTRPVRLEKVLDEAKQVNKGMCVENGRDSSSSYQTRFSNKAAWASERFLETAVLQPCDVPLSVPCMSEVKAASSTAQAIAQPLSNRSSIVNNFNEVSHNYAIPNFAIANNNNGTTTNGIADGCCSLNSRPNSKTSTFPIHRKGFTAEAEYEADTNGFHTYPESSSGGKAFATHQPMIDPTQRCSNNRSLFQQSFKCANKTKALQPFRQTPQQCCTARHATDEVGGGQSANCLRSDRQGFKCHGQAGYRLPECKGRPISSAPSACKEKIVFGNGHSRLPQNSEINNMIENEYKQLKESYTDLSMKQFEYENTIDALGAQLQEMKDELERETTLHHSDLRQLAEKLEGAESSYGVLSRENGDLRAELLSLKQLHAEEVKQGGLMALNVRKEQEAKLKVYKEAESAIAEWQESYNKLQEAYDKLSNDTYPSERLANPRTNSFLERKIMRDTPIIGSGESKLLQCLRTEIEAYKKEIELSKRDFESLENASKSYAGELKLLQENLESVKQKEKFSSDNLQEQLQELLKTKASLMEAERRCVKLENELVQRDLEISQLEGKLKTKEAQKEIDDEKNSAQQEKLKQLEEEIAKFKESSEAEKWNLTQQLEEMKQNKISLDLRVSELQLDIKAYESNIASQQEVVKGVESKWAGEMQNKEERIKTLTSEKMALLEQVSNLALESADAGLEANARQVNLREKQQQLSRLMVILRKYNLVSSKNDNPNADSGGNEIDAAALSDQLENSLKTIKDALLERGYTSKSPLGFLRDKYCTYKSNINENDNNTEGGKQSQNLEAIKTGALETELEKSHNRIKHLEESAIQFEANAEDKRAAFHSEMLKREKIIQNLTKSIEESRRENDALLKYNHDITKQLISDQVLPSDVKMKTPSLQDSKKASNSICYNKTGSVSPPLAPHSTSKPSVVKDHLHPSQNASKSSQKPHTLPIPIRVAAKYVVPNSACTPSHSSGVAEYLKAACKNRSSTPISLQRKSNTSKTGDVELQKANNEGEIAFNFRKDLRRKSVPARQYSEDSAASSYSQLHAGTPTTMASTEDLMLLCSYHNTIPPTK